MPLINRLNALHQDMKQWRQYLHRNPEIGLQEYKTSAYVQARLNDMGVTYHTGFANTGVIGVIKNGTSDRSIGLRADMDALPMQEENNLPYTSETDGMMHACGHDGHTTILLGTAHYLNETKNFDGTVYLYFQPGEEGFAGAEKMINDGAFDTFKPDAMYGLHSLPAAPVGTIGYRTGTVNANGDRFSIAIQGKGGHAARPHLANDPVIAASHLLIALQSITSRNVDPFTAVAISGCVVNFGTAKNVIPETGNISGIIRTRDAETRDLVQKRMTEICNGIAQTFACHIDVTFERGYPAVINTPTETEHVRQVACHVVGKDNVFVAPATMGCEDFAYFLQQVPGSFFFLGNGDKTSLHNPKYNFNDNALPYGVSMFVGLVETQLAP